MTARSHTVSGRSQVHPITDCSEHKPREIRRCRHGIIQEEEEEEEL
jgi:hypothetical protein